MEGKMKNILLVLGGVFILANMFLFAYMFNTYINNIKPYEDLEKEIIQLNTTIDDLNVRLEAAQRLPEEDEYNRAFEKAITRLITNQMNYLDYWEDGVLYDTNEQPTVRLVELSWFLQYWENVYEQYHDQELSFVKSW